MDLPDHTRILVDNTNTNLLDQASVMRKTAPTLTY